MIDLGIPVVPGSDGSVDSEEEALKASEKIGFPILIKATSGGGGKGMKVAYNKDELVSALKLAKVEAKNNFGNDQVYMERYLSRPRHIEVQVLADTHGNVVNLGERDCSLQRRHQKVWEEAPSPAITPELREKLGNLVNKAVGKMGYRGVGTLEFLFEDGEFFFMEMNTRIQVEHPITEMVTGIDLIKEQIRVAAGEKLGYSQEDIPLRGHAIECRVNAEDPETFIPSPGKITGYHAPGGWGVRVDSHLYSGYTMPPHYDSMVAKLIAYGRDRQECMDILKRAIKEYVIDGIKTTLPLHSKLVDNPDIREGSYDIHWLEKMLKGEEQS
jgi:acetyl-CoA carboxylase biotin carboxylase subunit